MSLEFIDFAHYYSGSGLGEDQQREHFEVFASILESLCQHFWQDDTGGNRLGIRFDRDSFALIDTVEFDNPLQQQFNGAASEDAAGKQDS